MRGFSSFFIVIAVCASIALGQDDPVQVRKAAERGNAAAQTNLGYMYDNGLGGLPKDAVQAVYWYRKAAEQGIPTAQYDLGLSYRMGRGLAKDDVQAVYWYRKAADRG